MFGERIASFYTSIEDKWYAGIDWLDRKGIPFYVFTDALEKRGIPSLPFTLAIVFLFVLLFLTFYFGSSVDATLNFNISDGHGEPLQGVTISLKDQSGKIVKRTALSDGAKIYLKGIPIGAIYAVKAEKPGYLPDEKTIEVKGSETIVSLFLKADISLTEGLLSLVDEVTGSAIGNPKCVASFEGIEINGVLDEKQVLHFKGVPNEKNILVQCSANGYETLSMPIAFKEGETIQQVMSPLTAALQGNSVVLISIYEIVDGQPKPLNGVHLKIENALTGNTISDVVDVNAEYQETLKKGTPLRITAEKEGYIAAVLPETTLREDEKQIEVYLKKGGQKLVVRVNGTDSGPLSDAIVQLFDSDAEFIKDEATGFGGFVEFVGLDPNATYYITAFKDLYVPQRKKIIPGEHEEISFSLNYATPQNTSNLKVKVFDSDGLYANGASLYFFEKSGEEELPLGLPEKFTDLLGEAIVSIEKGKQVVVKALKENESGKGEIEITQSDNELEIRLEKPINFVELKFVDEFGNPITGSVKISSKSGEELFDGNTESDGSVLFDSQGNETVQLSIEKNGEKIYEEELEVDSKKEIKVSIPVSEEAKMPSIEFLGVFDETDKEVEGISRGDFYYLKFRASLPVSELSGVHVRVGSDSAAFADEQRIGIYGYQANSKGYFYGRSYQPPSGQAVDLKNRGSTNEKNKWIEVYFKKPAETETIKVKIKADETFNKQEFELHYRAFAKFSGKYFNDPESTEKMPLYAETHTESVKVFTTKALCGEGLCVEFVFRDSSGLKFKESEFKPIVGKPYALEIKITTNQSNKVNISATAKEDSGVSFEGISLDGSIIPEQGYELASAELSDVSIERGVVSKAVVFFEPKSLGQTYIEVLVQGTENVVRKKFYFNVAEERNISIELPSKGKLSVGENLFVRLSDSVTSEFVSNAALKLINIDTEKIEVSTVGTNTKNNGLNGEYLLETAHLNPGFYKIVASAYGYIETEKPVVVLTEKVLEIETPIEIELEKCSGDEKGRCETSESRTVKITNFSGLPVEIKGTRFVPVRMPNEFKLEANLSGEITDEDSIEVSATFSGKANKSVYGESDLIVEGLIGNVSVEAKARVKITYNKEIPSDCIKLDKDSLKLLMLGEEGSTGTVSFNVEYSRKEECYKALDFKVYAEPMEADEDLIVQDTTLSIAPGEKKEVRLNVLNNRKRFYVASLKREFEIFIESDEITKSIPLTVMLKDPVFFLETNDNIDIWLSQQEDTGEISGVAPLFLKNAGELPIEQLRFSIVEAPFGINITVLPTPDGRFAQIIPQGFNPIIPTATSQSSVPFSMPPYLPNASNPAPNYSMYPAMQPYSSRIPLSDGMALYEAPLMPGQQLSPPKTIFASTTSTEMSKGPYRAIIEIRGIVNGKEFFLKNVAVWLHVSTPKCLKFYLDDTDFRSAESEQGVITKMARLENSCGETIRELSLEPKQIGENRLTFTPLRSAFLRPGEKAQWKIIMQKREDYSGEVELKAKGFLVSTQHYIESSPIIISIELGQQAETTQGPSYENFSMPICDSDEETELHYPMLSSYKEKDCSQGYCDAVQLSEFLLKKTEEKISTIKRRLQDGSFDVSNFEHCENSAGLCSFSSLDVKPTVLTVYLNNDNLSADVMAFVKEQGNFPDLKNFVTGYFAGDISDLISKEAFFTPFNIYLPKNLSGCGKFTLSIKGAVQNVQGKLQEDKIVVLIKLENDREVTPECTNEVQNVMNFLPVDKGLTNNNSKGAWPASIETSTELKELGEKIAEELFDSKDRSTTGSTSLNRIRLKYGSEGQEGILVIKIMRVSSTEAAPKTVEFLVTPMLKDSAKSVSETIEKSILEAVKKIAESSQDLDLCIDEQKESLTLLGLESRGEISINGPSTLGLYYEQESCVDLNVESPLREKIALRTNWSELKENSNSAGLSDVYLKVNNAQVKEYSNEKGIIGDSFQLDKKTNGNNYFIEFQLCALGDIGAIEEAFGKELKVKAKSATFAGREMKDWHSVKIELCWIHPYSLMDKLAGISVKPGETKTYYATLNWKGDPDKIPTIGLDNARKAMNALQQGEIPAGEPVKGSTLLPPEAKTSLLAHMGACAATDAIGGAIFFSPWAAVLNPLFDCILPDMWNLLKTTTWGSKIVSTLTNAWETAKKIPVIGHVIKAAQTVVGGISRGISKMFGGIYNLLLGHPSSPEITEEILPTALSGVQLHSVTRYLTNVQKGTRVLDLVTLKGTLSSTGESIAKDISERMANEYVERMLSGATVENRYAITRAIRENLAQSFESELSDEIKKAGNLLKKQGANAKLFGDKKLGRAYKSMRITDMDFMDNVTRSSWEKAQQKVWTTKVTINGREKTLMEWGSSMKGSELAKKLTPSTKNALLREIADPTDVAKNVGRDLPVDLNPNSTSLMDKARSLTDEIVLEIRTRPSGIDIDALSDATQIRSALQREISSGLKEKALMKAPTEAVTSSGSTYSNIVSLEKSDVDDVVRRALQKTQTQYADDFLRASDDAMRKIGQLAGMQADEVIEFGAKKSFWKKMKGKIANWRNLREFGKAAGIGMLANWVGGFVASAVNREAPQQAEENIAAPVISGEPEFLDGYIVSSPDYLYKGRPYKIDVTSGRDGKPRYSFNMVDTPEEREEMRKALRENPEVLLKDSCEEAPSKDMGGAFIARLVPQITKQNKDYATAYYLYGDTFSSTATKYAIDDSLLMAVLIVSPEKIVGCGIPNDWFKQADEVQKQAIECAGKKLWENNASNLRQRSGDYKENLRSVLSGMVDFGNQEEFNKYVDLVWENDTYWWENYRP